MMNSAFAQDSERQVIKDVNEALLKFEGFDAWGWESEFRETLAAERPDADRPIVDRMRLDLLRSFVDFVQSSTRSSGLGFW
jgi:hypothetical protein